MSEPKLEMGEFVIEDSPEERLLRQVTPHIWLGDDGIPAQHAFGPASADQGKPSYSRESVVGPQESFEWHNSNANSSSVGVWACSVQEIASTGLRAVDDSGTISPPPAPAHCYVDFRGLEKREIRNLRAILLRFALARGIIYPDSPVTS